MRFAALILLALAGSCSSQPDDGDEGGPDIGQQQQNVQCTQDSACAVKTGGKCMAFGSQGGKGCAYPDTACPSGLRYADVPDTSFVNVCTPATTTPDPQDPPEGW